MVFPTDQTKVEVQIRGEAPNQILDLHVPRGERGEIGPQGPRGPKVQVSVGDVMMGPAAPGTVGPQGLTGPKGDPGGIVLGTLLGTADLNSIITSGVYRQTNSSGADSPLTKNYPYQGGYGTLVVYETTQNATSDVMQEFRSQHYATGIDARGFWRRNRSNNVWSSWRFFSTQRIDQTAGRAIYNWDDVNGREQLTYGDTGWREISTVLLNGWTATSALIRRFNNMISFKLYQLNPSAATSDIFYILPSGFIRTHGAGVLLFPKTATEVSFLNLASTGLQFNPRGTTSYGTGGFTEVQWSTVDAWPTTLPGTASGSVTNM